MRTVGPYFALGAICAIIILGTLLLTAGLRSVGWDPKLAGLVWVLVLAAGYLAVRRQRP